MRRTVRRTVFENTTEIMRRIVRRTALPLLLFRQPARVQAVLDVMRNSALLLARLLGFNVIV